MWQSYIQPAFLYGMEITDYNKTGIKELETIQRNLMKIVLRVLPGTATSGVYAVMGLTDIAHEIWKRKLSYYIHIKSMPDMRWERKAFNEQFVWGQRDNFWNHTGERENAVIKGNYWLAGMQNMAKTMWYDLADKNKGMSLPINWRNHHAKSFIKWNRDTEIRETIPTRSTLTYLVPQIQDHQYNSHTQLWWMKMRLGSIRLKVRSVQDQKCVMCNIRDDTTEHMMHCDQYRAESIEAMLGHTLPVVNGL